MNPKGYSPKDYAKRGYTPDEEASYTRHYKSHMESPGHLSDHDTYTSTGGKKTYHTHSMTGARDKADAFAHHKVMAERKGERPNPSKAPVSPAGHDSYTKTEDGKTTSHTGDSKPSNYTFKKAKPVETSSAKNTKTGRMTSIPPKKPRGKAELPVVPKEGPASGQNKAKANIASAGKTIDQVSASKERKETRAAKPKAAHAKPSAPASPERNGPKLSETEHLQPDQFKGKHHAPSSSGSVAKNNAGSSGGGKHSAGAPIYAALAKSTGVHVAEKPKASSAPVRKSATAADLNAKMSSGYVGKHRKT
jgi:hypothetical protein